MEVISFWDDNKNYDDFKEYNDGVDDVIPNQSLTVKEILQRFRRGLATPADYERQGYYDDDEDGVLEMFDEVEDLTDIYEIKNRVNNIKERIYGEIQESNGSRGKGVEPNPAPSPNLQEERQGE